MKFVYTAARAEYFWDVGDGGGVGRGGEGKNENIYNPFLNLFFKFILIITLQKILQSSTIEYLLYRRCQACTFFLSLVFFISNTCG